MRPSVLLTLRLLAWRARRPLVVGAVAVLALMVARQLAPPPEPTEPVVVTARAVAAGAVLVPADLRIARVPAHLRPDDVAADPGALTGRETTLDLPRGVPVVGSMLDDGRFGWSAPPGTVTVPVRLVDAAVAGLLRPGDRVDLVAPGHDIDGGSSGVVLARGAVVLDVVTAGDGGGSALGVLTDSDPVTVVAVSPAEGHRLAGSAWGSLGAVLVEGS